MSIENAEKAIRAGIRPGMEDKQTLLLGKPLKNKSSKATRPNTTKNTTALPTSCEKWALFKLPEKLNEYFVLDQTGLFINNVSMEKASLSVFYYEKLCRNLERIGYHHLSVPVLALMSYLASDVLAESDLVTLVDLKMADVCEKLNLLDASNHYHGKLCGLKLLLEEQIQ